MKTRKINIKRTLIIFSISIIIAIFGTRYIGLQGRGDIYIGQTHSWQEIYENLPRLILVCLIFSFIIGIMIDEEKK